MLRWIVCLLMVSAAAAQADEAGGGAPRPVRVQTVRLVPAQDAVTYPGTVQARVQANLGFRVGGKVIARAVDIGDHVEAGQTLAQLDPADAGMALEADVQAVRAAEATAVNARAEFQRYQRLGRNSPAWLPSEFDKRREALDGAEARSAQAQRQLAMASDQLDYTTLKADAAGVITDLKLEVGQVVAAGQTVLTLAHAAETEIVVDVPENRLPDIRTAERVTIRLWSQPDQALQGRVREIGALADAVSRTFAVKVTLMQQPGASSALGMTAAVRFERHETHSVAWLPASAVVSVDGAPSVWVLDPQAHRATAQRVQVAAWSGSGEVAIEQGVANGMQVVTAGAALLDAGTPVTAWAGAMR
jgi:membrane fusion protein, multidrug efflux system